MNAGKSQTPGAAKHREEPTHREEKKADNRHTEGRTKQREDVHREAKHQRKSHKQSAEWDAGAPHSALCLNPLSL